MNLERYVNEDTHARIYGNIMNMYIVHMQCKVGFTPKRINRNDLVIRKIDEKLKMKALYTYLLNVHQYSGNRNT